MAQGLAMSVGLDLTELQGELSTLRSTVTNTIDQLNRQSYFEPTINTSKFTAAIQDMRKAYNDAEALFQKGFKFSYSKFEKIDKDNSDWVEHNFNRSFGDVFGNVQKMKKNLKELYSILGNSEHGVKWGDMDKEGNSAELEKARKLAQLLELYIDRQKTAGAEITKNKEKILEQLRAEKALKAAQEERIASLKSQLKSGKDIKNSDDLRQQLSILKQISREYRSQETRSGKANATRVDKQIDATKQMLAERVKQEKQEANILRLLEKQDELLKKQKATSEQSIDGLRTRHNLAKGILDIQNKVKGTDYYNADLVAQQQAIANPADALFNRKYYSLDKDFLDAQNANNLQAQLKAREAMLRLVKDREIQSGASLTVGGINAREKLQSEITAINANIEARKKDNAEKKKQEKIDRELAAEEKKLADIEKQSYSEPLKYSKKIRQLREEERMIDRLIRKWEAYRDKASKAGMVDKVNLANSKLSELSGRKAGVANAFEEQKAMIRSVNQNNSLLNEQASLLGKLRTLASRYFSIFTVFSIGKKIVETTGYFQQQQVALEGILGSASKAQDAITRIKGMALESPFRTKDIVAQTKQLAAYGIEYEQLLPTVRELGDLSAGLGVDMNRLILAFGQVKSAAVLRGQELRQFTEAGVPMVKALADKFTQLNGELVTTGQVFELISKRQVPFEMVSSVLRDMTSEGGKFYNMQEKITHTLYGQVEKIKDMWELAMNDAGGAIKPFLDALIKAIQVLIKNARGVFAAVSTFGILRALTLFQKHSSAIKINAKDIAENWRNITSQIGFATQKGTTFATKMQNLGKISKGVGKSLLAIFTNPLFSLGLSLIIGGIKNAIAKAREFRKEIGEIEKSFTKSVTEQTDGLDKLIGKMANAIPNTKSYYEAYDTLLSNYKDYVNPAIIEQLIAERKQIDNTTEGWNKLRDSIAGAITQKELYNQENAKAEKSSDSLLDDFDFEKILKSGSFGALLASVGIKDKTTQTKVKDVYELALKNYLDSYGTTQEELEDEVRKIARQILPEYEEALVSYTNFIYREARTNFFGFDKNAWKQRQESIDYIKSTDQYKIDSYFKNIKNQSRTVSRYVDVGDKGKNFINATNYNPYSLGDQLQFDYVAGLKKATIFDRIKNVTDEQLNVVYGGGISQEEAIKQARDRYNTALKSLWDTIDTTFNNGVDKFNQDSGKKIADSLTQLGLNVKDSGLFNYITTLSNAIQDNLAITSGPAARVATRIHQEYGAGSSVGYGVESPEMIIKKKNFFARYADDGLTEATFDEYRQRLIKDYKKKYDEIESYKDKGGEWAERINELRTEMEWLETLGSSRFFNIDVKQGLGSGGNKKTKEYPDFFNWFKNAYDQYKNATQQGGIDNGLALFKNNQELREMYGSLFMANSTDQKDFGFNIGNANLKAILDANRIQGGLEDGVIDFKAAAMAVAESMIEYGKTNETERGKFIQTGEQLRKWVVETLTKDEVTKWLNDLKKSAQDLSEQFERTKSGVELYRQLIKNGTQGTVGSIAGVSGLSTSAIEPLSKVIRQAINDQIANFNSKLDELKKSGDTTPYTPFSIEGNGDLNSLEGIGKLRKYLTDESSVNNNAFSATKEGTITKETLLQLLSQLENALKGEFSSLNDAQISGNKLTDSISSALRSVGIESLINSIAQANSADKGLGVDQSATKSLVDVAGTEAEKVMEQFMKKYDFSVMMDGVFGTKKLDFDKLNNALDKLIGSLHSQAEQRREAAKERYEAGEISKTVYDNELSSANSIDLIANKLGFQKKDLNQKALAAESKTGTLRSYFENWDQFVNAGKIAKKEYGNVVARGNEIGGGTFDAETNQFVIDPTATQEQVAGLQQINTELDTMGVNGEKYKQQLKEAAGVNLQSNINAVSGSLGQMKDVMSSLISSFRAMSETINEVYDVMNDGDNPEWMLEMNDYLSALGEAFEQIIAPVVAVIGVITALTVAVVVLEAVCTPLLIVMLAIIAAAAIVAAIVAAFKAHDKALERDIENLKKQVDALSNAMTNLNAIAERSTGFERLGLRLKSLGKNMEQAMLYEEMARKEDEKKDSDSDKIDEYKQKAIEARDAFLNTLKDVRDELTKSSDEWADKISETIRKAFQNGTNAARDARNVIKEMMGDIIEDMMKMYLIQPLTKRAIDELMGGTVEEIEKRATDAEGKFSSEKYQEEILSNLSNDEKLKKFYETLIAIITGAVDGVENMSEFQKALYGWNSEMSNLSGGIQGMTEDTGRTLEGIGNSMLGVMLNIQALMQGYFMAQSGYGNSPMTQIQTHLRVLESNVIEMRNFTSSIEEHISRSAIGTTPLHVTID